MPLYKVLISIFGSAACCLGMTVFRKVDLMLETSAKNSLKLKLHCIRQTLIKALSGTWTPWDRQLLSMMTWEGVASCRGTISPPCVPKHTQALLAMTYLLHTLQDAVSHIAWRPLAGAESWFHLCKVVKT